MTLLRRAACEAIGTALLLIAVVGSGIMGEHLAAGNVALALLANSLATGGALVALIVTFAPLSGAHFNPLVSVAFAWRDRLAWRELLLYIVAQFSGAWLGVLLAHAMFALPLLEWSNKNRSGSNFMLSEGIATFGLLALILSAAKHKPEAIPYAVAAYITGAYWFTSSTSFANPAVTLARVFTDTFTGIRWLDAPGFIGAQMIGALLAVVLFTWLFAKPSMR